MKPVSNKDLLQPLEDEVERHLEKAVNIFQNLSDERLLRPAADGGWSIAQCLEHLNSYGWYYLPEMTKAMAGAQKESGTMPLMFKSSWLGNYFTNMMLPKAGQRKYKAMKGHIPVADLNGAAVVAVFIHQQEVLMDLLRQADQINMNRIKIPISVMKMLKLKIGDVFRFLIAHNERHIQQALRNLDQNKPLSINF